MNQKRLTISLELLSAYLDNQLSEKDRSKVESALQVDTALKHDLNMLDATRRLLRNAPKLKVPRNFTLSASMVTKPNPFKFWMPAMSFSSGLAAILLVLSFVFNSNTLGSTMIAQTRNMEQFNTSDSIAFETMEKAAESPIGSSEEPPMIIQWFGERANGLGGGGPASGAAEGEVIAEEAAPLAAEAPVFEMQEADMADMEASSDAAIEAVDGQMPAEEPATDLEESLPSAKDSPNAESEENAIIPNETSSDFILGISPEEDRGQIIDESYEIMPQPAEDDMSPYAQKSIVLNVMRAGLLLLSITFAIIAYLMHRQRA